MKEKIKSAILVLLLISAVVLFLLNWDFDFSEILNREETMKIFDSKALMSDIVMPESLILTFENKSHTIIENPKFMGLWQELSKFLADVFSKDGFFLTSETKITQDIYYNILSGRKSILLSYPEFKNMEVLTNALGIKENKDFVSKYENFKDIYISLEGNYIIFNTKSGYYLLTFDNLFTQIFDEKVSEIEKNHKNEYKILRENFDTKSLGFYPDITKLKMEKIEYSNILEELDQKYIDNIIERFLGKETNFLREIKEKRQNVYVDGNKILKIGEYGNISYFNPNLKTNKDTGKFNSILSAIQFISNNLGFDDSLYLKKSIPISDGNNQGFKFIFAKRTDWNKVEYLREDINSYIDIEIYGNHVRRFVEIFRGEKQNNKEYFDFSETNTFEELIEYNTQNLNKLFKKEEEVRFSKEDLIGMTDYAKIIYLDDGRNLALEPCWKLKIEDRIFYFDIYTMEFIWEENYGLEKN